MAKKTSPVTRAARVVKKASRASNQRMQDQRAQQRRTATDYSSRSKKMLSRLFGKVKD